MDMGLCSPIYNNNASFDSIHDCGETTTDSRGLNSISRTWNIDDEKELRGQRQEVQAHNVHDTRIHTHKVSRVIA